MEFWCPNCNKPYSVPPGAKNTHTTRDCPVMWDRPLLVVGCGLRPKPGAINLDQADLPGVDVVWNIERIPLPFAAEKFSRVEAEDVIEHVNDPIAVVQELGRLLKRGGILWIRGPDDTMVWHDLTHKRAFSERTFDGFCPDTYDGKHYGYYHGPIKFRMVAKRLHNHGWEYTLEKL